MNLYTQKQRDIGARSAQKLSSLPTYLLEVSNSVLKPCMVLGISISPFLLHVLLFWVCNILLPSQHGKKPKPKKNSYFLQNDHLMVECTYNTSSKEAFTRGGFSARDEMCLVFMHYYPASNLAHCASRLSFQHVLLALGINVWPLTPPTRHLGLRIRDPWQYQNLTFR